MNEINIRNVDLNLLVTLDVLMRERSVSRTAQHLARTQSAISHALERLRQQLNDPLLVRQGGEMVPSPFALRLMEDVRPLLRQMVLALTPKEAFDPATAQRAFRISMRDFLAGLFPELLRLIGSEAPGIRVDWSLSHGSPFHALLEGDLDYFLGPDAISTPAGIGVEPVGGLTWACFAHESHPACAAWDAGVWDAETWARWPHVQVSINDMSGSQVSAASEAFGIVRRIGVTVPLFSAVPPVLASSRYLATLPRAVMRDQLCPWGLREIPLPFAIPPIQHALYSARRLNGDPGMVWFRGLLRQAVTHFMDVPPGMR